MLSLILSLSLLAFVSRRLCAGAVSFSLNIRFSASQHIKELQGKYARAKSESRKRRDMIETLQRLNAASQGNAGAHSV